MSIHFGGGAGTSESPTKSKSTVGRISPCMSIPRSCKLTSSTLKAHRMKPSLWRSVMLELYRFFSELAVASFVFVAAPVIVPWGCSPKVKPAVMPRVRPIFVDNNCFSSLSQSWVLFGFMSLTRAFSCCESITTLTRICLYAVLVVGSVSNVSSVNWTWRFGNWGGLGSGGVVCRWMFNFN